MNPSDEHQEKLIDQFSKQAAPFAQHHGADQELMNWVMQLVQPQADGHYLDVACGPGIVSRALAQKVEHVTGIDLVPNMIQEAQRGQAREGLNNLTWLQGDATRLPFAAQKFDGVITRFSFHHMPEPIQVLAEMMRVCKRDRALVVIDVSPEPELQNGYDFIEQLRDPSHTSALTESRFYKMGEELGLKVERTARFAHPTRLDRLLNASFPPEGNREKIRDLLMEDIEFGADRHGMKPWSEDGEIWFNFPVFGIVWR